MKTMHSLLIVLAMLVCTVLSACTTVDSMDNVDSAERKPLLFRNTPWGAALSEAAGCLPEGVQLWGSLEYTSGQTVRDAMVGEPYGSIDADVTAKCIFKKADGAAPATVAGYDIEYICLRFARTPDENGRITDDQENTALYWAQYYLQPKNVFEVYNDLAEKLTSIYGKPANAIGPGSSELEERATIWAGAEDTLLVLLEQRFRTTGEEKLYISYGTSKGDEWMDTAYRALKQEEARSALGNVDGL